MSFGTPRRLAEALGAVAGIECAVIFGSWAARYLGVEGTRPVGDIDLLVLGSPDREAVYQALVDLEGVLGYPVQVTFRPPDWLETGTGSFHDTVVAGSIVQILGTDARVANAVAAATASVAH
jgi:predicted nucleotidyltransferase